MVNDMSTFTFLWPTLRHRQSSREYTWIPNVTTAAMMKRLFVAQWARCIELSLLLPNTSPHCQVSKCQPVSGPVMETPGSYFCSGFLYLSLVTVTLD